MDSGVVTPTLVGSFATGARMFVSAWLFALLLVLADVLVWALACELLLELPPELLHAATPAKARDRTAVSIRLRLCTGLLLNFRNAVDFP